MSTAIQAAPVAPTVPKLVLNESEIAAALGVSKSWVQHDRCGARILPFYKIGGSVRYNLDRVRAALDAREEGGTPTAGRRRAGAA